MSSGGMFITRRKRHLEPSGGTAEAGFTLMSDLHIGAANVDYHAIQHDLETAREHGDRILINGDVFDAILPKDVKRYKPDALAERLQGRADVVDEAIRWAVEIHEPYADLIDMVGIGNHETAVEKYHGTDMVGSFVRALNRAGGNVAYGGYTGFVSYSIRVGRDSTSNRLVIYYHHGSGGSSPVTKGMIDFNRKLAWVDADVIWLGHKHNRIVDAGVLRCRCPARGDNPVMDPVRCIMTGAYMDSYSGQTQEDWEQHGRKAPYAADWGMAAQDKGGMRLVVRLDPVGKGVASIKVVA